MSTTEDRGTGVSAGKADSYMVAEQAGTELPT
jgi:hypothetical protein